MNESGIDWGKTIRAALALGAFVVLAGLFIPEPGTLRSSIAPTQENASQSTEPSVTWGNLGARMITAGVIDEAQLEALYASRGGLSEDEKRFLKNAGAEPMMITKENASFALNLFWALGLANKNPVLEDRTGMMNPAYGSAAGFASTGGWTLAKGDAMNHYDRHSFVVLTPGQQQLVERVSQNIYRPCCDNPTHFPDCNHGMAMLGLLELLASQGIQEDEMYNVALKMNSLWFPDEYAMITQYLSSGHGATDGISSKEILGKEYSSGSGFRKIAAALTDKKQQGGSCGV